MEPIEIKINAESAATAAEKLNKVSKSAAAGASGFRVLGLSAAKLGEDLGIPYRAAHLLGTRVEDIAKSTLPAWGKAFGVVGAVAAVAAGTYLYFTEQAKKKREELERSTSALWGEVSAHEKGRLETYELAKANEELYRAKKKLLELQLKEEIHVETKALEEEAKKAKDTGISFKDYLSTIFSAGDMYSRFYEKEKEAHDKAAISVDTHRAKLNILKAELKALSGGGTPIGTDDNWIQRRINLQKEIYTRQERDRQFDIEAEKAALDYKKTFGIISMTDQMAAEHIIFNKEVEDRVSKMFLLQPIQQIQQPASLRAAVELRHQFTFQSTDLPSIRSI